MSDDTSKLFEETMEETTLEVPNEPKGTEEPEVESAEENVPDVIETTVVEGTPEEPVSPVISNESEKSQEGDLSAEPRDDKSEVVPEVKAEEPAAEVQPEVKEEAPAVEVQPETTEEPAAEAPTETPVEEKVEEPKKEEVAK